MAKTKSPTGSKASRTNTKEQIGVNPSPSVSDVKAVVAEATPIEGSTQAETKAEPRKLGVVKTEPRRNVLPINLDDEIRRRAYELYQQRGGNGTGSEAEDWFTAEREIRQRYRQQSA